MGKEKEVAKSNFWQRLLNRPEYKTELAAKRVTVLRSSLLLQRQINNDWLTQEEKKELATAGGTTLIGLLPETVASIRINLATLVSRDTKEIQSIPETQREEWDLARVDEYAATLAKQAGIEWISIFPRLVT